MEISATIASPRELAQSVCTILQSNGYQALLAGGCVRDVLLKRVPAEDTAGSVREALSSGDKSCAAIAGRRAAEHYKGVILAESIQDNAENFTRFALLVPVQSDAVLDAANSAPASSTAVSGLMAELQARRGDGPSANAKTLKLSLALKLAHKPGALLAALPPLLLK